MIEKQLPETASALWALLADVLQALEDAGEDPKLEGSHDWRLNPLDHTPGIRRNPGGIGCSRKVEWNADGKCRWTAADGADWQWPGAERLADLNELARLAGLTYADFRKAVADYVDEDEEIKKGCEDLWDRAKGEAEVGAWDFFEALADRAAGGE